ncbi:MAG: hypothetical protein AAF289_07325 [Cyanobacteria bacterium P01_A01_bin.135]
MLTTLLSPGESGCLVVRISDTGGGISAEVQKIFNEFFHNKAHQLLHPKGWLGHFVL